MLPVVLVLSSVALAVSTNNVPRWTPTFNMSESTVVMPCNYSGLYDYDAVRTRSLSSKRVRSPAPLSLSRIPPPLRSNRSPGLRPLSLARLLPPALAPPLSPAPLSKYPHLAEFGLVDYDWSNAKKTWVDMSPMDADGMLVRQAARNKARNPTAKVFVYRNIVKALPWYTEVRKLLQNQSHWGWFIPYEKCRTAAGNYVCTNNVTGKVDATANLYHDEMQTPGWTGGGDGGPDGVCHGDTTGNNATGPTQSGYCDCGEGVSCGEYLWDHRNGSSLTSWFTETCKFGRVCACVCVCVCVFV